MYIYVQVYFIGYTYDWSFNSFVSKENHVYKKEYAIRVYIYLILIFMKNFDIDKLSSLLL